MDSRVKEEEFHSFKGSLWWQCGFDKTRLIGTEVRSKVDENNLPVAEQIVMEVRVIISQSLSEKPI